MKPGADHKKSINKLLTGKAAEMDFSGFIGVSTAAEKVREQAAMFAADPLGECVLITGERGTGKDLLAGEIHNNSPFLKQKDNFVEADCGALHEDTLHSTLFGHCKGSFTGSVGDHEGYFAEARGGSLYLNEIGNMPYITQTKLHRVIEHHTFRPLGAKHDESSDARLIFATNRDLPQMCRDKEFMPDLLDRLKRRHIHIPPLRERKEDIRVLSGYLAAVYAGKYKMNGNISIAPEVFRMLEDHDFPGNVRELDLIFSMAFLKLYNDGKKVLSGKYIVIDNIESPSPEDIPVSSRTDFENDLADQIIHKIETNKHMWKGLPINEVSCQFDYKAFGCKTIKAIYKTTGYNKAVTARLINLTIDQVRHLIKNLKMND